MTYTYRWILAAGCLLLTAFLSGCLEIKTSTRVNRDGSLLRTQSVSGDSLEALHRFPSEIDSTWTVTLKKLEKSGYERSAERLFRDAEEMNRAMNDTSGPSIRIRVSYDRKFRWFFTELTYRETYLSYNPFRVLPLSDFVTPAEIDRLYRHKDRKEPFTTKADSLAQDDAEKRWDEWRSRNVFEAFYAELRKGVNALADRSLTPAMLDVKKEELYRETRSLVSEQHPLDSVAIAVQHVLKSGNVARAMALNAGGFAAYMAKLEFVYDMFGHFKQTEIVMPGLIIDTNAPTLEGNRASFNEVAGFAFMNDYEIWVTSRVVNWWAVVVGGLLILTAAAVSVLALKRKRRLV